MSEFLSRLKERIRSFGGDRRGAIAVEFAFVAPLLLIIYLGTFEASQGLEAKRNVDSTAETVGNLVTRSPVMSDDRMENIFNVSGAVMVPFSTDSLVITVSAVRIDEEGRATVHWSKTNEGTGAAKVVDGLEAGSAYDVPEDFDFIKSSYLVAATVSYDYKTLFGYRDMFGDATITETYHFRPRKGREIPYE